MSFLTSKVFLWISFALNIVFGLVCLGTIASLLTAVDPELPADSQCLLFPVPRIFQGSWLFGGRSAPVLLFFTACAAIRQDILHMAVGLDAVNTRYMVVQQGAMAVFYLASAVASLALVSDPSLVISGSQKNITVAGASFGVLCSLTHGLTAGLSAVHSS